jgi:hypothetical protein
MAYVFLEIAASLKTQFSFELVNNKKIKIVNKAKHGGGNWVETDWSPGGAD